MSSIPMEKPGQIGSGNDMDMIKSYGGSSENQQSSTTQGSGLAVNTIPTDQVNQNSEIETKSDGNHSSN